MIMDKRRVYEWDTRVHLLAAGPGITAGTEMDLPVMNIDLAPTFLALAGLCVCYMRERGWESPA